MSRKFAAIVFFFICNSATAQQSNQGVSGSPVVSGPNGVFIFASDKTKRSDKPLENQAYLIFREDKKGAGFKKIATLTFPSSAAEFEKRLGPNLLKDILQQKKIGSLQSLYALVRAGRFDTLGLYMTSPTVMTALGILYIDTKIKNPDPAVSYRLESSVNANVQSIYQISLADIKYHALPIFKKYKTLITDSILLVTWYALKEKAAYATVYSNAGTGSDRPIATSQRQLIYQRRDTFFISYSNPTTPGSRVILYVRPEDIAGNQGQASDTVHLLSLKFSNTLSIGHLQAIDTLGGVWLTWDSLPAKAWCSGIEVLKSRSATGQYTVVDTLAVTVTRYTDRRVISGNVYYYQLRPLLYDLPQRGHFTPALVNVRTKKYRMNIQAPQGLHMTITPAANIRLSWLPNAELDLFAYYVLRGTSAGNMKVISAPIKDTAFVDSLKGLDAGITYLYSVTALNMDSKWGDTSAPVAIQSPVSKLIQAPGGLQARGSVQGVRLSWNDVSLSDPNVIGYMLYRRKKGETYFVALGKTALTGTYFIDSSALGSGTYEYGCSSVDAWSHVSILSTLAEVNLSGGQSAGAFPLYPPADFFLRNANAGIEIRVPEMVLATEGFRYNLYRRNVSEKKYQKIGELPMSQTLYTDKQVVKDQLYAYAVTLQKENTESSKSGEKSIRRK